jgi:hypothetical protein
MLDIKITFPFNGGMFFINNAFTWASVLRLCAFFFSYFLRYFFTVRGGVSINPRTSTSNYLSFISDILVISYVLSCAQNLS